jgi:hypothetical protein
MRLIDLETGLFAYRSETLKKRILRSLAKPLRRSHELGKVFAILGRGPSDSF